MKALHLIDIITIVVYFIIVVGFGIWSSFQNRGSVDGFFIARRSIHFIPIGASLFSSCIGTSLFIGLAGSAANSGIAVAGFELNALFVLILLGWVFIPVYIRAGVYTMPEYIKKRFGGQRIRLTLSVLSLLLNIFIRLTADLFGGALFVKMYLDLDLYSSIGILIILSALFTIGGGASAVIWTDFIQTIFMLFGAFILAIISFMKVGGLQGLVAKYSYAISSTTLFSNTTCGVPPHDYFNLHRAADRDLPWPGMFFGLTISAVWYWCSDQVIVQRALAAKNLTHAKAGCVFAGYLKLLPLFIIIFPGMISRILFNEDIACSDPDICKRVCGNENGCSNVAYPKLIIDIMPTGLRGLMVAVMIAALMSSLTSVFNSCSVIFTMDLWKHFRKQAREFELMIVGRVFVVVFVVISVFWIPVIEANQGSRLFDYIQSVTSFLAPPVCSVYVQAVLFKRINEKGAFWGLVIGLTVGMARFIWQFSYSEPPCLRSYLDKRPLLITKVHFLHFGIFLFLLTCAASWVISLLTPPIPDKYIRRLTYFTIDDEEEPEEMEESSSSSSSSEPSKTIKKKKSANRVAFNLDFEKKKVSRWRKMAYWICGVEKYLEMEHMIEIEHQHKIDTSIDQSESASNICNINAVIAMAVCAFMYAFFNKFSF